MASLAAVNALANANLLTFGPLLVLVMASLTVAVVGFSLLTPSATALVSRRSDPEKQGEILGVNQSASAMARILGPMLSLPLYFATAGHLMPYLVAGGLMLLMLAADSADPQGGVRRAHDPMTSPERERRGLLNPVARAPGW